MNRMNRLVIEGPTDLTTSPLLYPLVVFTSCWLLPKHTTSNMWANEPVLGEARFICELHFEDEVDEEAQENYRQDVTKHLNYAFDKTDFENITIRWEKWKKNESKN